MRRAPVAIVAVALLAAATAAMIESNAVRGDLSLLSGAIIEADENLTVRAEVVEVSRRHGHPVAVIAYEPPVGATRAMTDDGTPLPAIELAYLGDLQVTPGDELTARLTPTGLPIIDGAESARTAELLRSRASTLLIAAGIGYVLAVLVLAVVVRRWDGPVIRADTASRHGGA